MFKVEKTKYGFKMTIEGFMQADEVQAISKEIMHAVAGRTDGFAGVIDFRNANVMPRESQEMVKQLMVNSKKAGLKRSAVVLANPITTLQLKRLAAESAIKSTERYIDASKVTNWETVAEAWAANGVEPEDD